MTFLSKKLSLLWLVIVVLAFAGCNKDDEKTIDHTTIQYDAALAQGWMEKTYNTVKQQGMFALDGSRTYAYVAITMHESMVHSFKNGRSLAGQMQGLAALPQPDPKKEYNWGIVMCEAVPKVLMNVVIKPLPAVEADIRSFSQTQESVLQAKYNTSAEVMNNSKAFAKELSDAIITWAATDNRKSMEELNYTMPSNTNNPQYYSGNGEPNPFFMMPFWWTSRPFVISSYKACEPEPPYSYSEKTDSPYYKDVKEVYDASYDPAKVAIGKYWANNPGVSGTPAGSWIGIANQLVSVEKLDIARTVRMYARLAIGTRDAFIAVWYTKYKYNLERPITYIHRVIDKNWKSPVPTPPYPDYLSGTSTNAGCSSEILTRMFGSIPFRDAQHQDKGFGVKQYPNFKVAAREAFASRIYAGVHMRRACELGFQHGECIGTTIWNGLKFEK